MLTLYSHISSIPKYPLDFLRFSCDWNKKLNIARNRLSYGNVLGSNLGKMWNKSPQNYYKICLVSFASQAFFSFNFSCFNSSLRTHACIPCQVKGKTLSLFIMDIDIIITSQLKFKSTGDAGARSARARC